MITVGLDMSLTGTGVCKIADEGKPELWTFSTSPKGFENRYRRIQHIVDKVMESIVTPGTGCEEYVVCIEEPFVHPKHISNAMNLIALGYKIREKLYLTGIKFYGVAASQLKKFVLGKGAGEKSMVVKAVFKRWAIDAYDDNQADAAVLSYIARAIHERSTDIPDFQREVVKALLKEA